MAGTLHLTISHTTSSQNLESRPKEQKADEDMYAELRGWCKDWAPGVCCFMVGLSSGSFGAAPYTKAHITGDMHKET